MRKITTLLTTLVLILSLVVCVVPTSAAEGGTVPETVAFNDPVLEAMVRAAMGKPDGAITVAEAEAVTKLDLSFEWQQYVSGATPIESIGGLEHFKNLESLDLSLNEIADITPLASLTKLKILVLSGNPVTDITPLHALSALKVLVMSDCAAQDYSPLANLTSLEYLALERSTIADATPLASLTNLKRLYLEGCDLDYAYSLRITYHASEGEYLISLEKDGVGCSYQYYPATDDKGWEEPDLDTVHRMFNDALGTKEKELYYVPLEQFEQYVHERFGMSVDELYALPRY